MTRRATTTTTTAAATKKKGAATSNKTAASKNNQGREKRGASKPKPNNSKSKEHSKPPQSVVRSTRATRASKGKGDENDNGNANDASESKNASGKKRRAPLGDISDRVRADLNTAKGKGKEEKGIFSKNSKFRKLNPDNVETKKKAARSIVDVDENESENENEDLEDNLSMEERPVDQDDDEDASDVGELKEYDESGEEAADSQDDDYNEKQKKPSKKKSTAANTKSHNAQRPVRGKSSSEKNNSKTAAAKASKFATLSDRASKSRASSRTATAGSRTRKNDHPPIYHDPSSSEGDRISEDEISDEESAYSNVETEYSKKKGKTAATATKANAIDSTSDKTATKIKSTPVPKEYRNVSGIVRKPTPKLEEELNYGNGVMDWRCFGAIDY